MSSLNQKVERAMRAWLIATAGTPEDGSLGPRGYTMVRNEDKEAIVNENEVESVPVTTAVVSNLGSRFVLNWYVGETTQRIELPAVVVISESATEDPDLNLNYFCEVEVQVRFWGHDWSSYPDVAVSLESISEQIREALFRSDMPDEMSLMEPAFACQGVQSRECGRDVQGTIRMHRYNLTLYCCESDLIAA